MNTVNANKLKAQEICDSLNKDFYDLAVFVRGKIRNNEDYTESDDYINILMHVLVIPPLVYYTHMIVNKVNDNQFSIVDSLADNYLVI